MHSKNRISARWILLAGIVMTQVSCGQGPQVAAKVFADMSPEAPYQLPAEASNYARFEQKLELPSLLEVEQARQLLRSHEFSSLDTLLSELDEAASSDARQELRLKYIFDKLSADEATYKAWVKRNPLNSYAHIGLALHYDAKAWEARSGAFYQELSDEQKEGFARYKEQTRSAIAKARKLAPDSLLANRIHLKVLLSFGHKREHFKAIKAALEKFPQSYLIREGATNALRPRWRGSHRAMGDFVLAELAKPSANARIVSLLGKISADRANLAGQDDENGLALEHINLALRYGEEWSYYKSRAWYKYKLGDIEGALADAQRCVSIQPLATKCHNYVASRLIDLGQVEESKQSFDIAKRIDEDSDPWERWAARKIARQASQYFPDQLDTALAIYEHALSIDENYEYARYWRGDVLDRLGRQEEAMSDFLTVLKSKPEHLGARKAVDRILLPQGRFDEIIASWNELLQYNPDNSEALLERSGTYYHKGRRDLARADVERACELKNERACDTLAKYFNGS